MIKVLISMPIGFIMGAIREYLVVRYQGSIIDLNPMMGATTSWGIGHLDFIMFFAMAQFDNPWMAYGYIYGESLASYFGIKHRKVQVLYSNKKRKKKCQSKTKRSASRV